MTFLKRFFRALLRFIFRTTLVFGTIGLIGFMIWSEFSYQSSLTFLPENARPSAAHHKDQLRHVQWVALGGIGNIPSASLFPSHTFMRIAYHAINQTPPQEKPPTHRVTLRASRILMARDTKGLSQKKWHQARLASAAWIDKNWSMTERLDTILAESRSGLGCLGIQNTARRLLGKTSNTLSIEETALLVSMQILPFSYLKRSRRVLNKTNTLIRRLKQNYPKLYQHAKPITSLPFSVGALERTKMDCRAR